MKNIIKEMDLAKADGGFEEVLLGFKDGNPGGFNILNVSDDFYNAAKGRNGSFFDSVNKPWLDDAVRRGDDILVASSGTHIVDDFGKLNGFGKEIEYLTEVHGYRWNSDFTRLLPP
jgi:hypothetical protein